MTPLMFIIITSVVLLLLVYWVLSTLYKEDEVTDNRKYFFETAPELGTFDYNVPYNINAVSLTNEVKLFKINELQLLAQWDISENKWKEELSKINQPFTLDNIILRVSQTSAGVKSFDIPIKSLQGSHDFFSRPDTAYYIVLGIMQDSFIPVIFSNTIIVPPREESSVTH
jgi:hypothetical protein